MIQETIREQLPDGFQRAEYLLEHGMVDAVVHRKDLKATLGRILALLLRPRPTAQIVALPQPDVEIPGKAPATKDDGKSTNHVADTRTPAGESD